MKKDLLVFPNFLQPKVETLFLATVFLYFTYGGKRQLCIIAFMYGEVKYLQLQFGVLLYILAGIEKLQKNCKIWSGLVRGTIFMQFVRDNIR